MVLLRRILDKGIMRYMSSLLGDEFFEGRDHVETHTEISELNEIVF